MKKELAVMTETNCKISKKLYVQIEEHINTRRILEAKKDALTLKKMVKKQ